MVIAQPWPACIDAVNADIEQAPARSASSSTRNADLPPSSRKTFLSVAAPSDITARPVAVDPVNETMSTRGSFDSSAPTPWSLEVTMLMHARRDVGVLGDELAEDGRAPRGVGRRLEDDGVARRQRRAELGEVDLMRKVPRGDRADDADGLPGDRCGES